VLSGAQCSPQREEAPKPGPRAYLFISRRRVTQTYLEILRKDDIGRDAAVDALNQLDLDLSQLGEPSQSRVLDPLPLFPCSCQMAAENSLITLLYEYMSRARRPAEVVPTTQPLVFLKALRVLYRLFSSPSSPFPFSKSLSKQHARLHNQCPSPSLGGSNLTLFLGPNNEVDKVPQCTGARDYLRCEVEY
jgi:hypothetical protein